MNNNSLAVVNPKLASQWHPFRNGNLRPEDVAAKSGKKVWWWLPYDDPNTNRHFDFEWQATIHNRSKGIGCPYLSGKAVWPGFNDLETVNPELAREWHPFRNGDLKPEDVTACSKQKVWWYLPYDDPKTGNHFDFEWESQIDNRNRGVSCPYLTGNAVWVGFNDLKTVNPELARQWHPFKNGDLKPTDITYGSNQKVWWYMPYDDPNTHQHFDFEWEATVAERNSGKGCPFISHSPKVMRGLNDLATLNPSFVKEWHPTKNRNLKPENILATSHQKVWWYLPYDDPKTGKHFDFEWIAQVADRNNGRGCPYLNGSAVWRGFNDLATVNPKLAKEWHPTKNGDLKPEDVTVSSGQKVWWYLPYDDPNSHKHFDFEWEATIASRSDRIGCPYISGKAAWKGFNDLKTLNPELAREWHPTKNGNLKPTDVTVSSGQKVWWLLPYDDPKTGKHFDFEWQATVSGRSKGLGCPYISGKAVWQGFNDLKTVNPELARQWHPTKNGDLKPENVTMGSTQKVWWYLPYDDPKTKTHFNFEWEATVGDRDRGIGCPFLSGRAVWKGFNDLATTHPELAKEWHPTKNYPLKPEDVTAGSKQKVWWYLPYDDPRTGKHFDFEWETVVYIRVSSKGCPYLSGRAVWRGFNDLATLYPELVKEWHPTRNGNLKPTDVTVYSTQKVWWYLPYDDPKTGKHYDYEWETAILHRTAGNGCPYITTSKTERLVHEYLNARKLEFKPEKIFNHKSMNRYRYDIYIPSLNLIIEPDGKQHFEEIPFYDDSLEDRVNRDNIKNEFCYNNNIPILRIPYSYNPDKASKQITAIIESFIKTKKVPNKIIEFYKKKSKTNYADIAIRLNNLNSKC